MGQGKSKKTLSELEVFKRACDVIGDFDSIINLLKESNLGVEFVLEFCNQKKWNSSTAVEALEQYYRNMMSESDVVTLLMKGSAVLSMDKMDEMIRYYLSKEGYTLKKLFVVFMMHIEAIEQDALNHWMGYKETAGDFYTILHYCETLYDNGSQFELINAFFEIEGHDRGLSEETKQFLLKKTTDDFLCDHIYEKVYSKKKKTFKNLKEYSSF